MATVQLTFDFLCQGYGWSETWYQDTGLTSLKAFFTASGLPLLQKRSAMLGYEATLTAATASFTATPGDSYLVYTGQITGGLGAQIHCSSPHEAIWTIIRSDNDKRRRGTWFRGIPDDLVLNGGIFDPGYAPWVGPATTFMDAIVAGGWGWVSLVRDPIHYAITNYSQDPVTNFVDFTIAGTPFAGVTVGTYTKIRMLFKGVRSVLNGYSVVQVTGAGTCQSLKPEAVFPFVRAGVMTKYTPTFFAAINYSFQKAGERRAGRPKLHTRGHGLPRPKG